MLRVRVVKTASGANAVQVIYYHNRKRKIFKHIGSAKNKDELETLKLAAQDFINSYTPGLPLFEDSKSDNLLLLNKSEFLGVYYTFFHEVIMGLISKIGLNAIKGKLLLDLVVMRMMEPASKLRSIELLDTYFGLQHRRQSFYKFAPKWIELKSTVEQLVVEFAKKEYSFNYDLLFYDVTTLYFETFQEDELRQNGFSKDNKSQQPQILIALMVNQDGFPVAYEVFCGRTFEGHTILPVVKEFIRKHTVKEFTVVADAAMISSQNVEELLKNNINYIVGARLGNINAKLIDQIDRSLPRENGKNIRIKTDNGYLICSYSATRFRKDKYEMDKQIDKAKSLIERPGKSKKLKFTKSSGEKIEINEALITKTIKLLGIKGYYTNLDEETLNNALVIERYHELYKIEQAFRISKNDLQARPIFHFTEQPIKLHVLICFMALVISKHIELETRLSIRKFITECKKITDARIFNQITEKEMRIRTKLSPEILKILKSLNLPH